MFLGFGHFSGVLHHFASAKLASSCIRVNVAKGISKIESISLPGKGPLYFYYPTKITVPSNDKDFAYHSKLYKRWTLLCLYLVDKKICSLYSGVHLIKGSSENYSLGDTVSEFYCLSDDSQNLFQTYY